MSKSIFKELVKIGKKNNEYAFLLKEDDNVYAVKNWTPTGCYVLNAMLSNGDMLGGIADGKRYMISGESSAAKSLFTAYILKSYMMQHKNSYGIFIETEGSSVLEMCKSIGIPEDRMMILPTNTIEHCRTQMLNQIDKIIELRQDKSNADSDEKFIFCIDSLGMLCTNQEMGSIASNTDKRDLTKAQLLKGMARAISLKLSIVNSPLIIVNHVYSTFDKYNPWEISGGSGMKYQSDVHVMLAKSKEKEGTVQVGANIRIKVIKSRFIIENIKSSVLLHFKKGLYKYSSLVELAAELGVFKKEGISYILPDGRKEKMKTVRNNAGAFLNEGSENFNALREAIMKEWQHGKIEGDENEFNINDIQVLDGDSEEEFTD